MKTISITMTDDDYREVMDILWNVAHQIEKVELQHQYVIHQFRRTVKQGASNATTEDPT